MTIPNYVRREIEPTLVDAVRQFPAVALTGPRQSGKSTLLAKLFANTHIIVSFDDPVVRERAHSDPKLFLEGLGDHVVFDEIQYVPHLLSYIKILIDRDRDKRGRFIFTGSQQFSMIKNLGDTLAGRIAILELLPFSVFEKRAALGTAFHATQNYFIDDCLHGSFPEPTVHRNLNAHHWYGSYQQTYLERDIRTIYNIGELCDFQRFLQILAVRCAQPLNMSAIAVETGVAVNTVKRWLSILEASRIIYLLKPYYRNLGKKMVKNPKVFFLDGGLVCHLVSLKDRDSILKGPMAGALFENFCVQETVKAVFNHAQPANLYYVRTHNALEIDLIAEKNGKLYPVEFKLTKTPTLRMGDPILRFKKLFSKLSIMPGRIVSLCDENIAMTKDLSVDTLDDYLQWLKS